MGLNLTPLRNLLKQIYSHEICVLILRETAGLYREEIPSRWYFLMLNRVFSGIIDNPELYEADQAEPILEVIAETALSGIDAIEATDTEALLVSANRLTGAYSAVP